MEFKVGGMHCPACAAILEEEFAKVPGVTKVRVSLKDSRARVEYSGAEPPLAAFAERAEKGGYTAGGPDAAGKARAGGSPARGADARGSTVKGATAKERALAAIKGYAVPLAIAAGVLFLFSLVQGSSFMRMLSATGSMDRVGGAGIALLVGVAASFSSCLALVGSIVVAFSASYGVNSGGDPRKNAFRANALFHAGRLGTFFVLGGLLGELGGAFSVSYLLVGVIGLGAAAVMAVSGLSLAGFGGLANKLGLKAPRFAQEAARKLKESRSPAAPLALGAITFFLPCGFTQGMQAFALASGSFMQGGLAMLFFGIGTLPVLFAAGMTAHLARRKGFLQVTRAAGMLLIAFAVVFGTNAFAQMRLPGAVGVGDDPSSAQAPAGTTDGAAGIGGQGARGAAGAGRAEDAAEQVVEMHVLSSGYSPDRLAVKKGVPVLWKIYGDEISGCTGAIVVPSLGIQKRLTRGLTEIRFTPRAAGPIDFSCWMGMVWGSFQVSL